MSFKSYPGMSLGTRMKTRDVAALRSGPEDTRKEIKRLIYVAYQTGGTVPFSLSTLIDSGASLRVIRKVYRAPEAR